VADELQRVEQAIEAIEIRIAEQEGIIEGYREKRRGGGQLADWETEELDDARKKEEQLRKEKEQLRKKEEQLRKKEEQLREQETILLRAQHGPAEGQSTR
jgi:ribosomal protein S2